MASQRRFRHALFVLFIFVITVHAFEGFSWQDSPPHTIRHHRSTPDCREIHNAGNQCKFFKKYCGDEDDGFISYLSLYYCQLPHVKPIAIIICIIWLAELFTTLGTVASDFFSVNIGTIARALNTPDTLAGVSFLALGNGAPDIFSTIAATQSGSHGMAIGELLGAAAFITSVVAGSMALVEPFPVFPASLLRDALFLIVTIAFMAYVMSSGKLLLSHCIIMFAFYIFYVVVVVLWHWWLSRKSSKSKLPHEQEILQEEDSQAAEVDERTPLIDQNGEAGTPSQTLVELDPESGSVVKGYIAVIPRLLSKLRFQDEQRSQKRAQSLRKPVEPLPAVEAQQDSANGNAANPVTTQSESQTRVPVAQGLRQNILHVLRTLFPSLIDFRENNIVHKIIRILLVPSTLVLKLTVPVIDSDGEDPNTPAPKEPEGQNEGWDRWLLIVQIFCAPQFMLVLIANHLEHLGAKQYFISAMSCLAASVLLTLLVILSSSSDKTPRWHKLLVIPGFIWSVAWIAIVADETVAVFTALGVVGNVSEAILGFTIFAVGNSLDDLAANVSMARHRHPVMALAACFGGPLLNILIGVSVSGFILYCQDFTIIDLDVDATLFGETYMVLATLVALPCMLLLTRWRMTRLIGYCLIAIWVIGTAINLGIHLSMEQNHM